jgi:two-component system sensor histidine kinase VicK
MNSLPSTSDNVEEKTEVIYGAENIIDCALKIMSILKKSVDNCTNSNGPSMFVIPNHPITKAYKDLNERGIRIRFISEVTRENIGYCKELMKICELRHLDEVKGNFGIADGIYYTAGAKNVKSSPPPLLIYSTLRPFVEQQQYFFDMLWKKATCKTENKRDRGRH